ncbi:MAG: glycine--tRNA ligase subunit beta [Armatimonadota bacterium]
MSTILLEIGTEEMPAAFLPSALAQLYELARARFTAERIAFTTLHTWSTPRRITLYLTGVAEHQEAAVREVRGPSVQSAFASNGEPTQAALGFARSYGVSVNDLCIKKVDNTEYMAAIFRDEGAPTRELLPAIFTQLISSLTFPKTMRWDGGNVRFARPIRWIVAMQDDQVVPCTIGTVTADRLTRGHRFLAPGALSISTAGDYARVMDEGHVLVMPEARQEAIRSQLETIARQDDATVMDDGSLLEATTFQVEYPTAVRCNFDAAYLALPEVVVLQVLRHEQNFFPLADKDGKLLPAFIAVRNGDKAYLSSVCEGYEGVARAKLIDALFFFEQDQRKPLIDRLEELRGVVFHERLGTMHDKVARIQRLAGETAAWLEMPSQERQYAERAALLCKADLVTAMVNEHPELQGAMGGVYARLAGEPEPVAVAIREQYRPRGKSDPIPSTTAGRLVSLADKTDTVTACFAIGLIPTGSEDPYALRRDAQGVVRILMEAQYRLPLSRLLSAALAQIQVEEAQPTKEVVASLESFFHARIEGILANEGFPFPVVKAVMAVSADVPADALRRAQVLQRRLDDPQLATIVRISTRLANISRDFAGGEIHRDLLTEPAEYDLLISYQETEPKARFFAERGQYEELLNLLEELAPVVDRFFSDVLVMVEDPDLRQARLALIQHVANLFQLLADLAPLAA